MKPFSPLWGINPKTGEPYTHSERLFFLRSRTNLSVDVNEKDVEWLLTLAEAWELDPVKREIYLLPVGGKAIIHVGYQVYIQRTIHLCDWWSSEVWSSAGNPNPTSDTFPHVRPVDPRFLKDAAYLQSCYCIIQIKRKDASKEMSWFVPFAEVDRGTAVWKKMPIFMLKKSAIAQAFRLCFPDVVGGLPYAEGELGVDDAFELAPAGK